TSQPAPCGRATPRWSVAGHKAPSALSMAGDPGCKAMVAVGPPLSARAARPGSPTIWSLVAGSQVASVKTLWPPEAWVTRPAPQGATKQPTSELRARIVLARLRVALASVKVPTKTAEEPAGAVLPLIVELRTLRTPSVTNRALPCQAPVALPAKVLFVIVPLPAMRTAPPPLAARRPLLVLPSALCVTVCA